MSDKGLIGWLHRKLFANPEERFALASILLLVTLAIAPTKDFFREWRQYQRKYLSFASSRPDGEVLKRHFEGGIQQTWLPELGVVDRCKTCHVAVTEKSLLGDATVPEPFRAPFPAARRISPEL